MTIWLNRLASVREVRCYDPKFPGLYVVVYVLLSGSSLEGKMKTTENKPMRRKSMELIKDLTQILQEIIRSGDEDSFRW